MGKTLKVKELSSNISAKAHMVDVYAIFKEVKRGDVYAIFSDLNDTDKDILHYSSVYMKKDGLIFMDVKDKAEVAKEFTWKFLNGQHNDGFELINFDEYSKVELISSNELMVKGEVIKKLHDNTIPVINEEENSRISSSTKIVIKGLSMALLVVIAFLIINKDLVMGSVNVYKCSNSFLDTEMGATKEEIQDVSFDIKKKLSSRTITTILSFDDLEIYKKYVDSGQFYKIESKFYKSDMDYKPEVEKKKVTVTEQVKLNDDYKDEIEEDKLVKKIEQEGYQCIKVSE